MSCWHGLELRARALALAWALIAAACAGPLTPWSTPNADGPSINDFLAQGDEPWQPESLDYPKLVADFIVDPKGRGTHLDLQSAIDAVPPRVQAGPPGKRWVIQVRPGTYRGSLCIQDKAPLVLMGTTTRAADTVLVDRRYNAMPKRAGLEAAQPCHPNLAAPTHGTSGSASVIIASSDVTVARLGIVNDATEHAPIADGAQAVALMTQGDRIQLDHVLLSSHQDTFYVKRPSPHLAARVLVRASHIRGDVDFVFGNATLVIDDSTLQSRADRLSQRLGERRGGYVLAPSTPAGTALGFLVQRSRFVAEQGVLPHSTSLGRAWDEAVPPGQWVAGLSPNGHAIVRQSWIGPHIKRDAPWAASTSRRPYRAASAAVGTQTKVDDPANRLFEQGNEWATSVEARATLPAGQGWASMAPAGTVRGGADAAERDVHWVRSRLELVRALEPHDRPRIIQVLGPIDLSTDDAGRPLAASDFQHPNFNWPAFARAFEPANWGRQAPQGPMEEARLASARKQRAHVMLALPSRTTLIGANPKAALINGGLMLDKVDDLIIRHLHFRDAYDHFPAWDPKDNAHGEWNSEYDNLSLRGATRVWVDHCSFDDGDRPDSQEPVLLGRPMQKHDGLLDITRGSDWVTVSWNHFRDHAKTTLVGGSDQHLEDQGRNRVSFHHNLWEQTSERSPRVRFGRVHLLNNLYLVRDLKQHGYSIGLGHHANVLAEGNSWVTPPALDPSQLVRRLGRGVLEMQGDQLNGMPWSWRDPAPVDRSSAPDLQPWTPPYALPVEPAAAAAARVLVKAGAWRTGPNTLRPTASP